jgi:alkylation response protein AidB-like acyl-CoA dehydrogenase
VLTGTKSFVLDAHVADTLIVAARTAESDDPSEGITLFVIDPKASGVSVKQLKTMDMTRRLCEVSLDGVSVGQDTVLGEVDKGWSRLENALHKSAALLSAECVGGANQVLDMSVEYARNRIQFGRPIGSFQAVKHKCADMLVDVELSRSAMYYAAWAASSDESELALAASMAKSFCSDAYLRVATNGIHVHGGIGFTWEHDMHIYFKRAKANEVLLGDPTHHRDLVSRLVPA